MAPKSQPVDLTSVFLKAVASQPKITYDHVETALKDCRLGKKVVMGFVKDRVEAQRPELCKFLCKFFVQEQPRCSFNRMVVTTLDTDVSIISPSSDRYAYLMTCGHPCEPAGGEYWSDGESLGLRVNLVPTWKEVAKVDSRCAGRWHRKESNATASSHKQTYAVFAFTVPIDASAHALAGQLKGLGFPLDGTDGSLHPLPPALVGADARKKMAKSKYLKLFRKAAKPKKEYCSQCQCSSCGKIRDEQNAKKSNKEKKSKKST